MELRGIGRMMRSLWYEGHTPSYLFKVGDECWISSKDGVI